MIIVKSGWNLWVYSYSVQEVGVGGICGCG